MSKLEGKTLALLGRELAAALAQSGDATPPTAKGKSKAFFVCDFGDEGPEVLAPTHYADGRAGVGRIYRRPALREGELVEAPALWLSLVLDRSISDPLLASRFISRVRQLLERPYLLLF